MFADLIKIASSDPVVDSAYEPHSINGIALYHTREPNFIADITSVWEEKIAAVRCYEAQFDPQGMDQLVSALDWKSQQVAEGQPFARGEPLKVLHTSALHCGF
jgi:LmbE family N-acetylglucosaminyl deacetylase